MEAAYQEAPFQGAYLVAFQEAYQVGPCPAGAYPEEDPYPGETCPVAAFLGAYPAAYLESFRLQSNAILINIFSAIIINIFAEKY